MNITKEYGLYHLIVTEEEYTTLQSALHDSVFFYDNPDSPDIYKLINVLEEHEPEREVYQWPLLPPDGELLSYKPPEIDLKAEIEKKLLLMGVSTVGNEKELMTPKCVTWKMTSEQGYNHVESSFSESK